jgi:3-oxoacyl-[acyl-carrier-protein] synthase-3
MSNITAAITGVEAFVPDYILTNAELETLVETNDEWIFDRTGIRERRILKGENQGTSVMAIEACKKLLTKKDIDPMSIDLVICCTVTPDMLFPATANIISKAIGAERAYGFDMNAACSGFLYGLITASQFIASGVHKRVLLVGADKMSSITDYTKRETCILFGDGAGAVLLEPDDKGYGLINFYARTDGEGEKYLFQSAGGSRRPPSHQTIENREHFVHQEGKTVFKYAVMGMGDASSKVMEMNNLKSEDIAFLVPHQANKRIIEYTAQRMGLSMDKVMLNIDRYGNTTNATIPLCLKDYENQLKKGDNLILAAFGGGFTWGAAYMRWALG